MRDHSTTMICFVHKCNWFRCNVGCHGNRQRSLQFNDASAYTSMYFPRWV